MAEAPIAHEAAAAVVGAVCHVYAGHPFDTVKLRLQTEPAATRSSVIKCFANISQKERPSAFYRGAVPALLSAFAEYGVLFTTNEGIRRGIASLSGAASTDDLSLSMQAVAGGVAGACCGAAMGPFELLKCKLQTQQTQNLNVSRGVQPQGPLACMMDIVRVDGVVGLFRGTSSTIARECPFNAVLFGAYEGVNYATALINGKDSKGSTVQSLVTGGLAGTIAWATILPIDYVKSRIQASQGAQSGSFVSVFSDTLRKQGLRQMYAGFGAVCVRAFTANAALFWGYEQTKRCLLEH